MSVGFFVGFWVGFVVGSRVGFFVGVWDGLVVESGQLGDLLLHLPGPLASPFFSLRSEVLLLATSFV